MSSERDPVLPTTPTRLFIGGTWSPSSSGETFPVEDPSTGWPIADVADVADARSALDAACGARSEWAGTAPRHRSEILRRAFALMVAQTDRLASLITAEMGKPLAESAGEVAYAAEFLRWFAEEAVRIGGEYRLSPASGSRILSCPKPVGPCLLITPWNLPLAMLTRKVGPALAAGCTMVIKPAEQTPLSALALADLLVAAGEPPGVCNVIPTSHPGDTVAALSGDPRLRKLSFTGSTETGRLLLGRASTNLLRSSMELGGNAPFLVLADADVDAAVSGAMIAKMRNMGESCVAANRFLVHEAVREEFTTKLTRGMAALRVGPGTDPASDVGPIIDADQRDRIVSLVDEARDRRASVTLGGTAPHRTGRASSTPRRSSSTHRAMRPSTVRRSSDRLSSCAPSPTPGRCSPPPTTPTTASWRSSIPGTCPWRSRRSKRSPTGWSASVAAWSPTLPRRSAASSTPGSCGRATGRGSTSTSPSPMPPSTSERMDPTPSTPSTPARTGAFRSLAGPPPPLARRTAY